MTESTESKSKSKKPRRSIEQRIADKMAELQRLQAIQNGTHDETTESGYMVKRLREAIRRRETAINVANVTLFGRAKTEASPALPPIANKIENAQRRLADMLETQKRANEVLASVPQDILTLDAVLTKAEAGEVVEFPSGLFGLPSDKTETQVETEAAAS